MITSFLLPFLFLGAADCHPVPGADRLWAPTMRFVVVGEVHGINETPDALANLACLAAESGRPVTVALEYDADTQPVIDAWLQSDGSAAARTALLAMPFWHRDFQDGRSSVAFLRLFEQLRRLKQAGRIRGVVASDVVDFTDGKSRDAWMAQAWQHAVPAPNGLVLVLVGNLHAMRQKREGFDVVPAASFLPRDQTVTINAVGDGGEVWTCQQDGCGKHGSGAPRGVPEGMVTVSDPAESWDVQYNLGRPTTASVPAVPKRGG